MLASRWTPLVENEGMPDPVSIRSTRETAAAWDMAGAGIGAAPSRSRSGQHGAGPRQCRTGHGIPGWVPDPAAPTLPPWDTHSGSNSLLPAARSASTTGKWALSGKSCGRPVLRPGRVWNRRCVRQDWNRRNKPQTWRSSFRTGTGTSARRRPASSQRACVWLRAREWSLRCCLLRRCARRRPAVGQRLRGLQRAVGRSGRLPGEVVERPVHRGSRPGLSYPAALSIGPAPLRALIGRRITLG